MYNYANKHTLALCPWVAKQNSRKAYAAAVSASSVLVSTSTGTLPAVSLPVVVSGSDSVASSDQSVVEAYERSAYMAARQRLGLSSFMSSLMAPYSFVTAVFFGSTFFYDNCCSVSIVNKLEFLLDIVLLERPFRIGGIADGVTITHRGKLPISLLPDGLNDAFYSADARSSLISLGFIQRNGGYYESQGKDMLIIQDKKFGNILDRSIICDNNLYPVTLDRLRVAYPNIPVDSVPSALLTTVGSCVSLDSLLSDAPSVPSVKPMFAVDRVVVSKVVSDTIAIAARGCVSALLALTDVELVHRYERDADLSHAISIPSQDAVAFSYCAVGPVAYGAWQDGVQHFSVEQRDRCDRALYGAYVG